MNKDIENISKYGNLGRIELKSIIDARGPRPRRSWAQHEAEAVRRREQYSKEARR
jgi:hypothetical protein